MFQEKCKDFYASVVKNPQLILVITLLFVCGAVIGLNLKWFFLLIVCVIVLVMMIIAYNVGKAEAESAKNNIRISGRNSIVVEKRSAENRRMLSILNYREQQFDYHPATATFTAATVGGVTTGGLTVNEDHYTSSLGAKTNKCSLQYTPLDDRVGVQPVLVKRISLSENDAKIAYSRPQLRQFLTGDGSNALNLEHKIESKNASAARNYYNNSGDMYGAMNLLKEDYTKSLLTRDELESIVEFLCGY